MSRNRRRHPDVDRSNPTINLRQKKRSNQTYQSVTDPCARLFKKSKCQPADEQFGA
jgi:hypothetical protein